MGLFFGTDGMRGIVGKNLTFEMVYRCGVSLALQKKGSKILLGKDTRKSGDVLSLIFAAGAISEGAYVEDMGVCPTAAIGYLTKKCGFDFGVVVSASHNSFEYNGIKIFDKNGRKINEELEKELEKTLFYRRESFEASQYGEYIKSKQKLKLYEYFLLKTTKSLEGLKIVLDCANGASCFVAEKIFKKLNANVLMVNNSPNGLNINEQCGALYVEQIRELVVNNNADMGFSFDGDADRLIAVDEYGNIIDGDMIILMFATEYLKTQKLNQKTIVGTYLTNSGVEEELNKIGIELIRTDVGDKFIDQVLEKNNLIIGGEQCGHVFLKDKLTTGDGILNAILIAHICKVNNKKLSQFFQFKKHKQVYKNVVVKNKNIILNCKNVKNIINNLQIKYKNLKIILRPSGTEQVVRIMVESKDKTLAENIAEKLEKLIKEINEGDLCVE